jgi:maltooligosyltrehalose trehalohydrolase
MEPPDPQDETTFLRAKLNHQLQLEDRCRALRDFYQKLIRLRKESAALARLSKEHCEVTGFEADRVLLLRRWSENEEALAIFNFNVAQVSLDLRCPRGQWRKVLDSTDKRWQGRGSMLPAVMESDGSPVLILPPRSLALFTRAGEEENRS